MDSKLEDLQIIKKYIYKKLMKLKIDKSTDPDAMHQRPLKETAEQFLIALEIIYNSTLKKWSMPKEWKQAHIPAIFKKGNKTLACNYWSVSLTSIACKSIE